MHINYRTLFYTYDCYGSVYFTVQSVKRVRQSATCRWPGTYVVVILYDCKMSANLANFGLCFTNEFSHCNGRWSEKTETGLL